MLVHYVNLGLIFYWWALYALSTKFSKVSLSDRLSIKLGSNKGKHFKSALLFLPFVQIYLMLALKSIYVGTDTMSYLQGFGMTYYVSWSQILNFNSDYLVFNFERGFIILTKLILEITENYKWYFAILYVIMIYPVYRFTKKHSPIPHLTLILFITLGFFNFYFSGVRQAIAMSIILISFDFIVKRKLVKFVITVLIAMLIHKSAIFFLPAYFLFGITITPVIGAAYFASLIVVFLFRSRLFQLVADQLQSGKQIEETGAYTLLLIVFFTFVIGLITYKRDLSPESKLVYNLVAIAAGLMIFNTVSNIALRVSYYYFIFMILFIPNIITAYRNQLLRRFALLFVLIFTIFFYLKITVNTLNVTPYWFFWEKW